MTGIAQRILATFAGIGSMIRALTGGELTTHLSSN
jgi:hypothetical protein